MRVIIYPYKMSSASARNLADNVSDTHTTLRVHPDGRYRPRADDVVINWGNSASPTSWNFPNGGLNKPAAIAKAANKIVTFRELNEAGLACVDWTTDMEVALRWVNDGGTVLQRNTVAGHSGEGIMVVSPDNGRVLTHAPLYTRYKKKKHEYRVHVFNGNVFDIQEKKRERDWDRTEEQSLIRSHHHGWNFCRDNLEFTGNRQTLETLARQAIVAVGLDFGAVDIIYNAKDDVYYVLEVNTAVGLEGTTLEKYTQQIENFVNLVV